MDASKHSFSTWIGLLHYCKLGAFECLYRAVALISVLGRFILAVLVLKVWVFGDLFECLLAVNMACEDYI